MIGAFACAVVARETGSFGLGVVASLAAAAAAGALVEMLVIRRLYARDHLDQVLATFALILIASEGMRWMFGSFPLYLNLPPALAGTVALPGGLVYPVFRLGVIVLGALIAGGLFLLMGRTRLGARIRAGEADREMMARSALIYQSFTPSSLPLARRWRGLRARWSARSSRCRWGWASPC